ncbi:arylamine N-acetyltransferase [Saccharomonospora piscinae]|uniref:Arylamine N-acetyltransferase n=1 Tax=Saccharomonospora piscinae TaxID=687388 RepID=A0A1V9ACF3_SACPI|nr:arylamine N-acetyltransferase [Saccharomonospora piscinae]OQO94716.1 arylamine N-acetyltransferase [Saccharomonospora piscinae]
MTETRTQTAHPHIDWDTAGLDLDAYHHRIGQSLRPPSPEALFALHEAHVRTIPFENVDVVLGRTPSLRLADIAAKLVDTERGGYCFEHGLLFAAVLDRLGYDVTRGVARVRFDQPDAEQTHLVLLVRTEGERFLADVGFGAGPLVPLPLRDGARTDHGGWPFRLRRDGGFWLLENPDPEGDWRIAHGFDETPQRHIDYVVGNHYIATHPDSAFTGRLVVMRKDRDVHRKLVGDRLVVEYADETPREVTTVEPGDLGDTLRSLGIVVTGDDLARLSEVYAGSSTE